MGRWIYGTRAKNHAMNRSLLFTLWLLSLFLCGWLCWLQGRSSQAESAQSVVPVRLHGAALAGPAPPTGAAPAKGMAAVVAKVSAAADMAPDSEAFANAVREVLREPDERRRMAAWYAILEGLSPAHLAAIVPLIKENDTRGPGSGSEWAMLWEVWAAKDGDGAMSFLQNHDWNGWSKLARPGARYNAMIGWGRGDAETAAAWLQQPGNHQEDLERALIAGWSNKDPEAAAAWVISNQANVNNMDAILGELCRRGGVERLEEWFQQQTAQGKYLERGAKALASAKIRNDPAAAAEWLVKNEQQPWWGDGDTLLNRMYELAGKSPELAMQTAQRMASPHAAGFAMDAWCEKDIRAASEWMKSNPNAPQYDKAATALASRLKSEDPEAARAWAETIRDAAHREFVLKSLSGQPAGSGPIP